MFEKRNAEPNPNGPTVVALGGGHGLAASLRGARMYARRITAIVSVGDDGGSSGRLRAQLDVSAPGDIRRCLSALADDRSLLARSLEYRFEEGELSGHPIGNLLLAGLALAGKDLQRAIDEVGAVVGAAGRVVPATAVPVVLVADSDQGVVTGQVAIERAAGIRNLRFEPHDPPSSDDAVDALMDADQIVLGPGSFYTSVLAAAVAGDVRRAMERTTGQRIVVANVATERVGARDFGLEAHLRVLADHAVPVDLVIANCPLDDAPFSSVSRSTGVPIMYRHVAASDGRTHDPLRLAAALSEALNHARLPQIEASQVP